MSAGGSTSGSDIHFKLNTKNPKDPAPSVTKQQLIAKPGSPHAMRIINMSRSVAMDGKRGAIPQLLNWAQRETMISDTISAFAPMYQHFAQEFQIFKNFKKAEIETVIKILETSRAHDVGLINELETACPGIANALYSVLLPQYSRGQHGVINSLISLDNADLLQRFNALGFGTQLRAEMLQVLNNANFFVDIRVDIQGQDIKIMKQGLKDPLVEGKVNNDKKTVALTINANVRPEDRDDAIKHLLMFAACHAQQNNSNVFRPKFGDNIYENIRLLQLAIGEFNLRIPQESINAQMAKLHEQIAQITDTNERTEAENALNKWIRRAETFSDKLSTSGIKLIDKNNRPKYESGNKKDRYMNNLNIQKTFRNDVTESIFPTHAPTLKP